MSKIKSLDNNTIHRICSGQVIISLANAVKELIENSLDAGAKNIEVKLKEFGSESIEVVDDGPGIDESEFEAITSKHCTSKIQSYDDLETLETFGFRGEALNSLCALCNLAIITRFESAVAGTRLEYNQDGSIKSKNKCARPLGTTVILEKLFHTLPVRHKEFTRNIKKEFNKLLHVIQSYCLISDGIKLSCFNIVGGKPTKLMNTNSKNSLKDNIIEIFGINSLNNMIKFEQHEPSDEIKAECNIQQDATTDLFKIEGYVSSCAHGVGRSASDRQHLYINKRPCESQRIMKAINDVYHQYNRTQYPMFVLNILLDTKNVDVNVTPDKLQMFIRNENILLAIMKASLFEMYGNINKTLNYNNDSLAPKNTSVIFDYFTKTSKNDKATSSAATADPEEVVEVIEKKTVEKAKTVEVLNEQSNKSTEIRTATAKKRIIEDDSDGAEAVDKSENKMRKLFDLGRIVKSPPSNNSKDASRLALIEKFLKKVSASPPDKQMNIRKASDINEDNLNENEISESPKKPTDITAVPNSLFQSNIGSSVRLHIEEKKTGLESLKESGKKTSSLNDSLSAKLDIHYGKYKETCVDSPPPPSSNSQFYKNLKNLGLSVSKSDHDLDIYESETDNEKSTQSVSFINTDNDEDDDDEEKENEKDDNQETQTQEEINTQTQTQTDKLFAKRKVKTIDFSLSNLQKIQNLKSIKQKEINEQRQKFKPKNLTSKDAEDDLDRCIRKEDFLDMKICGQFNKGFIVAQLAQDLFIIDQHAADEIYNFETLQKTNKIERQRLLQPHYLELSASAESLLIDNLNLLEKAGYEIQVVNNRKMGNRIMLTCVPMSSQQNKLFDLKDIDELLFILSENDCNIMSNSSSDNDSQTLSIKSSSLRAMYASKACRKSVMIGDSLNKFEMKRIVSHLSEIQKPWNCPHGRPTLRHLINLDMIKSLQISD